MIQKFEGSEDRSAFLQSEHLAVIVRLCDEIVKATHTISNSESTEVCLQNSVQMANDTKLLKHLVERLIHGFGYRHNQEMIDGSDWARTEAKDAKAD